MQTGLFANAKIRMNNILLKPLARESICSCGFPALHVRVSAGKIYKIPRFNAVGCTAGWVCGNCGKETEVHPIMVLQEDGLIGWLPKELFDWDEKPETPQASIQETSSRIAPTEQAD